MQLHLRWGHPGHAFAGDMQNESTVWNAWILPGLNSIRLHSPHLALHDLANLNWVMKQQSGHISITTQSDLVCVHATTFSCHSNPGLMQPPATPHQTLPNISFLPLGAYGPQQRWRNTVPPT
jgi:hypothetical protein